MPRLNTAKTFKGEAYATEKFVDKKIGTLPEGVESVIDSKTGILNTELNPIAVASMENSTGTNDFSKLKIIGDCSVIYGANGLITLRIGPALNCSLFNGTDGISVSTVTDSLKTTQIVTISSDFSDVANTGSRTVAVKGDSDKFTANCGTTKTTSTVAGNGVHFEGDGTCKFKVYIKSGKGATTENSYVLGPIKSSDMTNNAKNYVVSGITCAVTNYAEEPKKSSGASGYCANVNFTIALDTLFGTTTTDFQILKIEQIEVAEDNSEAVVSSWTNDDTNVYMYLADLTTPGVPTSASYVLTKKTTKISGVTYLTTETTMTPSATGLTNCGYPGYVTNKANCSPSGGTWFTAFNSTATSDFTTWSTVQGTTMDWNGTAASVKIGKWENPQIIVKGTNMHGSGSGATSAITNNKIYVCDASGHTSTTYGSFNESGRLDSSFDSADFSDVVLSETNNTDLQIENGYIVYPSTDYSSYNKNGETSVNPNYSTCTGDRYYYLKLQKSGTIMGGTITIATDVSAETALTQTKDGDDWKAKLKIELSNDKTNWMDIGRTSTNGGIGATFSYGTTNTISFSIPSAAAYGNGFLYARVTMTSNAGVKIASIALS